jgi:hypothetical protein
MTGEGNAACVRQQARVLAADGARLIQPGPLPPAAAAGLAAKITGPAVTAMEQAVPLAGQAASPFLLARTLTILAGALSQAGNTTWAPDRLTQASRLHGQLHLPGSRQVRAAARELAARLQPAG